MLHHSDSLHFNDSQYALSCGLICITVGAIFNHTYIMYTTACNAILYVIYNSGQRAIYKKRGKCSISHFALLKVQIK